MRNKTDYQFSLIFELNNERIVSVSKDLTSILDGQTFTLFTKVASKLRWYLALFNGLTQEAQNTITTVTQYRSSKYRVDYLNAFQSKLDTHNVPEGLPQVI